MIDLKTQAEIEQALIVARATPDFTFLPRNASAEVLEALQGHAAATGKQVMEAAPPSRAESIAASLEDRNVPVVKGGDNRAFIQNLEAIARGDVRVDVSARRRE